MSRARTNPIVHSIYRLLLSSLTGILLAACTSALDERAQPLAGTLSIEGCAAAGEQNNTLEALPSPGHVPPGLDDWEENMVDYGSRLGDAMVAQGAFLDRLKMNYYDGQRIFLQIADYTGQDEPWETYAEAAEDTYKTYLERNDFGAAGHMRFPHGLFMDWKRNGDSQSREYLLLLRDRAAVSNPEIPKHRKQWRDPRYSREVAYALENQVLAERAGGARQPERVDLFVGMALAHIDAWTTGEFGHSDPEWRFCQAFMAGLTATALITYDDHRATTDRGRDPRVLPRVESLADWLWQTMWIAGVGGGGGDWYPHEDSRLGAFEYVQPTVDGVGSESPAPDLNLLIAPMYGWLYEQTGASRFRDRGDAIFAGGVAMASLKHNKLFNQNYRDSFDYVQWRRNGATTDAD